MDGDRRAYRDLFIYIYVSLSPSLHLVCMYDSCYCDPTGRYDQLVKLHDTFIVRKYCTAITNPRTGLKYNESLITTVLVLVESI